MERERKGEESTVKIFEQSIQTPCGLYWRQPTREQLLRMANEEDGEDSEAVQLGAFLFFFFFSFFLFCHGLPKWL